MMKLMILCVLIILSLQPILPAIGESALQEEVLPAKYFPGQITLESPVSDDCSYTQSEIEPQHMLIIQIEDAEEDMFAYDVEPAPQWYFYTPLKIEVLIDNENSLSILNHVFVPKPAEVREIPITAEVFLCFYGFGDEKQEITLRFTNESLETYAYIWTYIPRHSEPSQADLENFINVEIPSEIKLTNILYGVREDMSFNNTQNVN